MAALCIHRPTPSPVTMWIIFKIKSERVKQYPLNLKSIGDKKPLRLRSKAYLCAVISHRDIRKTTKNLSETMGQHQYYKHKFLNNLNADDFIDSIKSTGG